MKKGLARGHKALEGSEARPAPSHPAAWKSRGRVTPGEKAGATATGHCRDTQDPRLGFNKRLKSGVSLKKKKKTQLSFFLWALLKKKIMYGLLF